MTRPPVTWEVDGEALWVSGDPVLWALLAENAPHAGRTFRELQGADTVRARGARRPARSALEATPMYPRQAAPAIRGLSAGEPVIEP